ncbi:hypothetical protein KDL01_14345 [Actinospica durhamensis]|uniref:Uncharacterized protein n=1 Tax=Actinospica durhamensis TaxID=1508375 RepID=A0A941ENE6_9ACTN|nr:hypothetical protein [Actinospica durhamensis]MBR7834451.1 hypothetical protein [Actinospica durhamensis]
MNTIPDTAAEGGGFDPRQAADLLERTRRRAMREFEPAQPWLLVIRAVLVLGTLGTVWLTVRRQDPYTGPKASVLLVVAAFVVVNFCATVAIRRRATVGVSGRSRFTPVEIGLLAASWIAPYAVMAGVGVTGDSRSGTLLTVPLIVVGLVFAGVMAVRADWRACGTGLAVAVTGAVGASVGQAGAWAVTAVGLCVTLLGSAAAITLRLHHG